MLPESSSSQFSDINFSLQGPNLLAHASSDNSRVEISTEILQQLVQHSKYAAAKLDEQILQQWVQQYNSSSNEFFLAIGEWLGSVCDVSVDDDGMAAYLTIAPAADGTAVTRTEIFRCNVALGITRGLDNQAITSALAKGRAHRVLIARGVEPVHGEDSAFEKLVPEIRDRSPQIDESGRVNYHAINRIPIVSPGQPLLRRIPATPGKPGQDIFGNSVEAIAGTDIPIASDLSGVHIDNNDENLLVASIKGQPVISEQGAIVEPTIHVDNVDLTSGDIDFDGTIYVSGNVTTGMRLKSTGDIIIDGMVEAASNISAKGDIFVKKGIIGRGSLTEEEGNPGKGIIHIQSEGNIHIRFIENAVVNAAQQVLVEEHIAHSQIFAEDQVIIGNEKCKHGHVIGGSIKAGNRIQAKVLGSPASIMTLLEVGSCEDLQNQLQSVAGQLEEITQRRRTLELNFAQLCKTQLTKDKNKNQETLKQAKLTMRKVGEEIALLTETQQSIKNELQQCRESTILCNSKAYPNIIIKIAGVSWTLDDEKPNGCFQLGDDDTIKFTTG